MATGSYIIGLFLVATGGSLWPQVCTDREVVVATGERRSEMVKIRVTPTGLGVWQRAAEARGLSLSAFVLRAVNALIRAEAAEFPPELVSMPKPAPKPAPETEAEPDHPIFGPREYRPDPKLFPKEKKGGT